MLYYVRQIGCNRKYAHLRFFNKSSMGSFKVYSFFIARPLFSFLTPFTILNSESMCCKMSQGICCRDYNLPNMTPVRNRVSIDFDICILRNYWLIPWCCMHALPTHDIALLTFLCFSLSFFMDGKQRFLDLFYFLEWLT